VVCLIITGKHGQLNDLAGHADNLSMALGMSLDVLRHGMSRQLWHWLEVCTGRSPGASPGQYIYCKDSFSSMHSTYASNFLSVSFRSSFKVSSVAVPFIVTPIMMLWNTTPLAMQELQQTKH